MKMNNTKPMRIEPGTSFNPELLAEKETIAAYMPTPEEKKLILLIANQFFDNAVSRCSELSNENMSEESNNGGF